MILIHSILSTLYPHYCLYCDSHLSHKEGVCRHCFSQFKLSNITHPYLITLNDDPMSRKLTKNLDKNLYQTAISLMVVQLSRHKQINYDGVTYLHDYQLAKGVAKMLAIPLTKWGKKLLLVLPYIKSKPFLDNTLLSLRQKGAQQIDVILLNG